MSQDSELKQQMVEAMKAAMKSQQKDRLGTLRLILAAIKQREVDERISLSNEQVLEVLNKMIKQRRESILQYEKAGRQELADKELDEIKVIEEYMPEPLSDEAISGLIVQAIAESDATTIKDMGKVMAIIKPKIMGKADVSSVSKLIKAKLS